MGVWLVIVINMFIEFSVFKANNVVTGQTLRFAASDLGLNGLMSLFEFHDMYSKKVWCSNT